MGAGSRLRKSFARQIMYPSRTDKNAVAGIGARIKDPNRSGLINRGNVSRTAVRTRTTNTSRVSAPFDAPNCCTVKASAAEADDELEFSDNYETANLNETLGAATSLNNDIDYNIHVGRQTAMS